MRTTTALFGLVVLALVLVAATVVFLVQARSDAGGGSQARTVSREYTAVTKAARARTARGTVRRLRPTPPLAGVAESDLVPVSAAFVRSGLEHAVRNATRAQIVRAP